MRVEAERYAGDLWAQYSQLATAMRGLTANTTWSTELVAEGVQILRRTVGSNVPIPMPRSVYGALIKGAMMRLLSLAVKMKRYSGATDIRAMFPYLVAMREAGMALASSIGLMGSEARPAQSGASGLGVVPVLWLVGPAAPFIVVAVMASRAFMNSLAEAEHSEEYADGQCSRQERATGRPCTPEDYHGYVQEGLSVIANTGTEGAIRRLSEDAANWEPPRIVTDATEKITTAVIIAASVGGALLLGLGVYAAWPYISAGRGVGKRLQKAVGE